MTLSIMTFSTRELIVSFGLKTLTIMTVGMGIKCHYAECHYAECRYAECHYAECHYAECQNAEPLVHCTEYFI
jgi:hypothetical protein